MYLLLSSSRISQLRLGMTSFGRTFCVSESCKSGVNPSKREESVNHKKYKFENLKNIELLFF